VEGFFFLRSEMKLKNFWKDTSCFFLVTSLFSFLSFSALITSPSPLQNRGFNHHLLDEHAALSLSWEQGSLCISPIPGLAEYTKICLYDHLRLSPPAESPYFDNSSLPSIPMRLTTSVRCCSSSIVNLGLCPVSPHCKTRPSLPCLTMPPDEKTLCRSGFTI